jgi:hypothetical protein
LTKKFNGLNYENIFEIQNFHKEEFKNFEKIEKKKIDDCLNIFLNILKISEFSFLIEQHRNYYFEEIFVLLGALGFLFCIFQIFILKFVK